MAPVSMLRCPATHEPLHRDGDWLRAGDHSYPVIDGIPVLINEDLSPLSVDEIRLRVAIDKPSRRRMLIRRLMPNRTPAIGAAERYREFRKALLELNDVLREC